MKKLVGKTLIEDLNLKMGEKVQIGEGVFKYAGVERKDGKIYDILRPVGK